MSRVQVMNGTIHATSGGLTKKDIKKNKRGKYVSKVKSKPLGRRLKKNEFFCVACRKPVAMDAEDIRKGKARKTGQALIRSKCKRCDTKVVKFVKA